MWKIHVSKRAGILSHTVAVCVGENWHPIQDFCLCVLLFWQLNVAKHRENIRVLCENKNEQEETRCASVFVSMWKFSLSFVWANSLRSHPCFTHTETFAGRSLPNWWVERIKRVRLCEAATREHWKITSNRIERVKRQKSSSTHSTRQKRKSHRINSNTAAAGVYAIHTSTSSRFSQFDNFWCSDNTVFCLFLCTYSLTYRPVILYYINVCAYAFHPYFPGIKIYLVKFFFLVFCCVH